MNQLNFETDDGRTYQMPWAEHNGFGNITSVQVRDIARGRGYDRKAELRFVTEAARRAWIGLPSAN